MYSNAMKVKVTRKYQITIPAEVRERLGIGVGDVVEVRVEGDRIIMEKAERKLPILRLGKRLTPEDEEELLKNIADEVD